MFKRKSKKLCIFNLCINSKCQVGHFVVTANALVIVSLNNMIHSAPVYRRANDRNTFPLLDGQCFPIIMPFISVCDRASLEIDDFAMCLQNVFSKFLIPRMFGIVILLGIVIPCLGNLVVVKLYLSISCLMPKRGNF